MGISLTKVTDDEVVAEWVVDSRHHQPAGIVHGGVHCGVIETVCSVGGHQRASQHGQTVVGVENHTSFIRAVKAGKLRAVGKPLQVGRRAQLWEANVTDEEGRLVATGRVRLFCVEAPATDNSARSA
jgi:1,4-dihydroxy-2-naphthoyl-CoA hydrolase